MRSPQENVIRPMPCASVPLMPLLRRLRRKSIHRADHGEHRRLTVALLFRQLCLLAIVGLLQLASLAASSAAETDLEEVYVAREGTLVYSGPSKDFYPTNRLASGTRLKVYHQTNNGWLGVQPTSRAFSWVPAKDCYLLPGGKTIEITNDQTVCWIGTALGRAKQFRWQVKLDRGEKLKVQGEQVVKNSQGEDVLWYKVSPPSGEFRWIPRDQVVIQYDPEMRNLPVSTASATGNSPTVVTAQATESVQPQSVMEDEVFGGSEETLPGPQGSSGGTIVGPEEIIYEGEYYDGMSVDGQIIGGEIIDGTVVEGDVFYEDGTPYPSDASVPFPVHEDLDQGHFAGWHAMHFGNDGLRLPWLAKLFGAHDPPRYDPLSHDPFSLEPMPQRKNGVVAPPRVIIEQEHDEFAVPGGLAEGPYPQTIRRPRAWRDPRTLRSGPVSPQQRTFEPPLQPRSAAEPVGAPAIQGDGGDEAFYNRDLEFDMLSRGGASRRVQELRAALRDTVDRIGSRTSETFRGDSSTGAPPAGDSSEIKWYGVPSDKPGATRRVAATPTSYSGSYGSSGAGPYGGSTYRSPGSGAGSTSAALNNLTMRLSEMVAGPENTWNLRPLAEEAQSLIEKGGDVMERGQARLLLERIEEFQRFSQPGLIASRGGVSRASYQSAIPTSSLGGAGNAVSTAGYVTPADQSRYDATGWLVLVHGSDRSKPPYALTDDSGRIIAYLSPLPGLKFETLVNKPVGVNGLRGYLPQLQAAHIQAERVHPLNEN